MTHLLRKFRVDEDGAVTVDWVVLTAVIMAAVALLTTPLRASVGDLLLAISAYLDATGADVVAQGSALD